MTTYRILLGGLVLLTAVACGKAPESEKTGGVKRMPDPTAEVEVTAAPQLQGRFEVSGNETWETVADAAQFNCQSAYPGVPFRAQWFDQTSNIGILVTGHPLDDGSNGTRTDYFQLTYLDATTQKNADLSEASLSVEVLSKQGMSAFYKVSAKGTIKEGGSFQASGTCRA